MLPTLRRDTDLTSYDPFRELDRLTRDLFSLVHGRGVEPDGMQVALADLEETDDDFVVTVDLPGVDKGDVDVELEGRRLTVTAERRERERTGILRRRTRHVGSFRHEVVLPAEVADEDIEAELRNGVLTLRLPKAESSRRRRIPVR